VQPLLVSKRSVDSDASARDIALWVREVLGCQMGPIDSLVELCERAGQFVLVTEAPGEGASVIDGDIAAAVVSLSGDPARRRATAAHELGHLVVGDEYSNDLGVHASPAEREEIIDAFAAELLLPTQVLTSNVGAGRISRSQLVELAARYRVSWSLALRQAAHVGVLDSDSQRAMARSGPREVSSWMRSAGPRSLTWLPFASPGYAHAVLESLKRGQLRRPGPWSSCAARSVSPTCRLTTRPHEAP
jgi:Zn-dependent peptidase ImmA (M78 family)